MTILLVVLALLTALAFLKIGLRLVYEEDELQVEARCLFFHRQLVGDEKKPPKQTAEKQKTGTEAAAAPKPAKKPLELVKPFLPFWREILAFCGRVLTAPTIKLLRLEVRAGGKDACACALHYGRICAAASAVLPVVENTFTVQKREISIACDYEKTSVEVRGELQLFLRVYEILILACGGLKLLLRIRREKHQEKAVQTL